MVACIGYLAGNLQPGMEATELLKLILSKVSLALKTETRVADDMRNDGQRECD